MTRVVGLFRPSLAAVDDDIGLGIDRMAPLDQLGEHRSRIARCSSGRLLRRDTRATSTSRSARSHTETPRRAITRAGRRVHEGAAAGRQDMRRLRPAAAR